MTGLSSFFVAVLCLLACQLRLYSVNAQAPPDTCMTTWLGSTSLAPEAIANAELALRELSPPVDDRTKGTANRILLNAILGSSAAADGFLAPCTGAGCGLRHGCLNGGQCVFDGGYKCSCPEHITGDHCETVVSHCSLFSPCKNAGTCVDNGPNAYICQCLPLFSGVNCESLTFNPNDFPHPGDMQRRIDEVEAKCTLAAAQAREELASGLATTEQTLRSERQYQVAAINQSIARLALPTVYSSCKEIKERNPGAPSGYYYIRHGSAVQLIPVYCEMDRFGGGWTRIADIKAARGSCPGNLRLQTLEKNICSRPETATALCASSQFNSLVSSYSEVMGFVTGYTERTNDAFDGRFASQPGIEGEYVDGVSITAGSPRRHVWTYAVSGFAHGITACPCQFSGATPAPDFVGNDYFCSTSNSESHSYDFSDSSHIWSATDVCPPGGDCCFKGQPWFYKALEQATADALELRVCGDQLTADEDVAIDAAELFVR